MAPSLYNGGFETTKTALNWFMLAMIAYPEQQRKIQEELDAVVGRSRLPTFEDRDKLQYLQAAVRELLRWRPFVPFAVPHLTNDDDVYEGYFIPKGTLVFPNTWSLNREKSIYGEDADDFNPGRFIKDGELTPPLEDTSGEGHLTFGFGHRRCIGRHAANNSLFIFIASILWANTIAPVKDDEGKPIIPDTLETAGGGVVVLPVPFKCIITPRFPEAAAVVLKLKEKK